MTLARRCPDANWEMSGGVGCQARYSMPCPILMIPVRGCEWRRVCNGHEAQGDFGNDCCGRGGSVGELSCVMNSVCHVSGSSSVGTSWSTVSGGPGMR